MFNNVGEKIKSLATAVLCVNIVLTLIGDLLFCRMLDKIFDLSYTGLALTAILIAVFGIFVSWMFLLFVYGFGIIVADAESRTLTASEEYENEDEDFEA